MTFKKAPKPRSRRRRYIPPADLPWYRPRGYRHFDPPVGEDHARNLVQDLGWVERHSFLPFIRYVKLERRYKWPKRKSGEKRRPIPKESKKRPIAYAAHTDSIIFARYGHLLSLLYEKRLRAEGLENCVLAYRKFPGEARCNVHFARDAFLLVNGTGLDTTVGLDVEAFFDTIDHARLKLSWCELLGVDQLPLDHYKVFRALTAYAYVDRQELVTALGISFRQLTGSSGKRLCSAQGFRERIRGVGLVKRNMLTCGIPQGSPMSAVLLNIFMLPFDRAMKSFCDRIGAVYRRYSDDILVVCNRRKRKRIEDFAEKQIRKLGLEINREKTTRSRYTLVGGQLSASKPFQYLGFVFDGRKLLIRSKSLAKYHRRTDRAIAKARRNALHASVAGGDRRLRRTAIYARCSHLDPKDNFPGYVVRTRDILGEGKEEGVRQQFKSHWPRLNQRLCKADEE